MTERWRQRLERLDTLEPSPDLWRRATARVGETFPDLPPGRRHRVVAVVVAVALAATGLVGVSIAFGRGPHIQLGRPSSAPTGGMITYRDPSGLWQISYPRTFRLSP